MLAAALPKAPSKRWRRRAGARPEEILDAALAEFDERGFDAARMEDIARRAGISKGGVYLYFNSKMALLEALIEAKVAPLAQQAEAIARAGENDPVAALRALANAAAHRLADPRVFAVPRLVIALSARFPDLVAFYRTRVVEVARGALERIIAAGVVRGVFRAVDPAAASRAFIGAILFEGLWAHVIGGDSALKTPDKLVAQHMDIFLKGLGA